MTKSAYSVKQINAYIKNMFQQDYMLNRVYVMGEASNVKYHSSGHIYFSLKDESGTLACVMFAGQRSGLSFRLCNGQQVVVFGSIQTYERSGTYQLYARGIRLDGEGALYERFIQLKNELEEMGMFAYEYKKPIPTYAKKIGIVTAPTGAAVRDIINVSKRRNPFVQLYLYPALVQGEGAAESIARGIEAMDRMQLDVIIVGRGGGSMEDLWAFNEEIVARAIFDAETPIISAVGHETDTTIADYVADLRAPTPSAAAEIASFDLRQLENKIQQYQMVLNNKMNRQMQMARLQLSQYDKRLRLLHPKSKLQDYQHRSMDAEEILRRLMQDKLLQTKHDFQLYLEQMKGLSPLQKLNQGFAFTTNENGKTVKSISQVQKGDLLNVYVADGLITSKVEKVTEKQ